MLVPYVTVGIMEKYYLTISIGNLEVRFIKPFDRKVKISLKLNKKKL